ncbi:MAG: transmembrane 220 family protein, partial [Geminicoccales bacterium]
MRYVNGFFCLVMIGFTVVQYNDPDAIVWILIYGITALWAGMAAFGLDRFARSQVLITAFGASLVAIAALTVYDWPPSIADWWENELVREGLGLIISTCVLLVAAYTLWQARREPPTVAG